MSVEDERMDYRADHGVYRAISEIKIQKQDPECGMLLTLINW